MVVLTWKQPDPPIPKNTLQIGHSGILGKNSMPSLPPLEKLLKDPAAAVKNLSPAQIQAALEQARLILESRKNRRESVPDSPASFAAHFQLAADGGKQWLPAPHLKLISDWLSDAEKGLKRFLLVSMPPRHGKSELISFLTPLWLLSRDPTRKIILASYEAEFAQSWGRRCRNAINEHPEFGLELDMSSTAASHWRLTTGGGMETAGAGGPMTGKGTHCLIIDDPIKNYEEASSETIRENLWNWFQSTAFTRLEPGGFCIILATRWHEDDLIGRLDRQSQLAREQEEAGKEPDHIIWDVLKIPAIAEEKDPLGRELGSPLWPDRYDLVDLERIKKSLSPYNWSALYQQRPTPEEGGAVKRSWWKYYKVTPSEFDQMIQTWDLAFFDLQKSDYSVGQVWGRKGSQFFLLDQIRDHMTVVDCAMAMRHFTQKYPKATAKLVEAAANGPAMIQTLQHEVAGMIPVKPKGTKDARLQAVIPVIQAGNVFLPQNADGTLPRWVSEFINECASFPNGTHDDQLDAMVHGLTFMLPKGWQSMAQDWKEASYGVQPANPEQAMTAAFHQGIRKHLRKFSKDFNRKHNKLQIIRGPKVPWKGVV